MNCELCGHVMKEGTLGTKAWICTNRKCERSNETWLSAEEKMIREQIIKNEEKIEALKCTSINGLLCTIEIDKVRFMAEGSGKLVFENGLIIPFIKTDGTYEFYGDDHQFDEFLHEQSFIDHLEQLRYFSFDRLSEILK